MKLRTILFPMVLFALSILSIPLTLSAQERAHGAGEAQEELGEVDFPVSCSEEAQDEFERAVALLHSFFFEEADDAFGRVLTADPECAMAWWGKALTHVNNPFASTPGREASRAGLSAIQRGLEMGPPTERERGYLEAAALIFRDHETVDGPSRMLAYEEAMENLAARHPDDPEASIFYAQALVANQPPGDDSYQRLHRADSILSPLFEERPDHPGLAHYIIHANDVPPLAERGLEAALRYADIAPAAPHALHMPSHIFTRLGMWDESIETNRRSAETYGESPGRVHPMDYKVYAFLQQGRDGAARSVVDEAEAITAGIPGGRGYNAAAMSARYHLEREEWNEVGALPVQSTPGSPAEAVTRFARGIGSARSGDLSAAREEATALARIRDALRERGETDWGERVEAQRLAVEAWIRMGEERTEIALEIAERAAALEEAVEKHPVTPGPLLPARELQGDLLLELGRAEEALRAYEATLEREPNRARATFGAAVAAERRGDLETAARHYRALVELMDRADPPRPELERARSFLAQRR